MNLLNLGMHSKDQAKSPNIKSGNRSEAID